MAKQSTLARLSAGLALALVLPLAVQGSPFASAASQPTAPIPNQNAPATSTQAHKLSFLGHYGGRTGGVALQGTYAYLAQGPGLTVLDISNPALPQRQATQAGGEVLIHAPA